MADPEHDHGFVYDFQGRVDIHQSSFFNLNLEIYDTIDNYVDRILFTLTSYIEEHQGLTSLTNFYHWPSTDSFPSGYFSVEQYYRRLLFLSGITRFANILLPVNTTFMSKREGAQVELMDPEQIQQTLDLIVGQLGTVTQQIRETQGELADFRRQAGEHQDNIERSYYCTPILIDCFPSPKPSAKIPRGLIPGGLAKTLAPLSLHHLSSPRSIPLKEEDPLTFS
ncbi:hypothetical protein M5K25_024735 [Dendrobium thyrsiflorum]|uniref:Uncharacterized protein n=1 Tax=Dendrobium thyrsiflorum TaxID=117978 RepID=A0ABD0U2Z5_DENTH